MAYDYYLTAVDVLDSPLAMPRICEGLHCPYPTANVSASTDPFRCAKMNCPQPRADVQLMLILLRLINATADVIPTAKTFDEAVSMVSFMVVSVNYHAILWVHNGTADITLKHIFQLERFLGKVDFTSTVRTMHLGYIVKETTELEVVNYILKAFTFQAITLILISSFCVAILSYLYTKVLGTKSWTLFKFAMLMDFALLKQLQLRIEGPACVRVLICFWLLFSYLVVAHFETKIRSILMLAHYTGSLFETLDGAMDAMEYYGWKMSYDIYTTPFDYCVGAQCERLQELRRSLVVNNQLRDHVLNSSDGNNFAFTAVANDVAAHERCIYDSAERLLFIRDRLIEPIHLSFGVRKGKRKLLKELNRAITTTLSSLDNINLRLDVAFPRYNPSLFKSSGTVLSLAHFEAAYKMFLYVSIIGVIALATEMLFFRYHRLLPKRLRNCCQVFLEFDLLSQPQSSDVELTAYNNA